MKFEIFKFKNVTSTNDVAINLIKENHKNIGYVYAEMSTAEVATAITSKENISSTVQINQHKKKKKPRESKR